MCGLGGLLGEAASRVFLIHGTHVDPFAVSITVATTIMNVAATLGWLPR